MNASISSSLQQAMAQLQQGNVALAESVLVPLNMRHPNHPDVLHLLAMAAKQKGSIDAAEQYFMASLKAAPRQAAVHANFANLLVGRSKISEAIKHYRQAVELEPGFVNGWYNLALTLAKAGQFDDALRASDKLMSLTPGQARSVEAAASIKQKAGDEAGARALIEALVAREPKVGNHHYVLANLLRAQAAFSESAAAYEKALQFGVATPELFLNLAEVYYENQMPDRALETYGRGLARFPGDAVLHTAHAKFLWQVKPEEDHLKALKAAIPTQPNNMGLWGSYFDLLAHQGRHEDILKGLSEAYRVGVRAPRLTLAEAAATSVTGDAADATKIYERLLEEDPVGIPPKISFAEHLLKSGDPERAEALCAEAIARNFHDQQAWAYRGTAWQLMGDDRADWIFDFENMVRTVEVLPPAGYSSGEEFFAEVARELDLLHRTQAHPIDQTLRGGTQTNGFLFRMKNPVLRQLEQAIREAIERTVQGYPDIPDHPFWGRKSERVAFKGAWSVKLKSQGYHTNHFHPEGWLSSALYISLPPEVDSATTAGHIQFGEPVAELGLDLTAKRTIRPEVGKLALFPSYMWHGTVPFSSAHPRMTVAFDVVPAREV